MTNIFQHLKDDYTEYLKHYGFSWGKNPNGTTWIKFYQLMSNGLHQEEYAIPIYMQQHIVEMLIINPSWTEEAVQQAVHITIAALRTKQRAGILSEGYIINQPDPVELLPVVKKITRRVKM